MSDANSLLVYTLRPEIDATGRISQIGVTAARGGCREGDVLFELRHVAMNVLTPAHEIVMRVSDAAGNVPVTVTTVEVSGQELRQWRVDRDVQGCATARFAIDVPVDVATLGVAPPLELRSENGAVSGGAAATLPRPPGGEIDVQIRWDLSRLPEGAAGVSSLGDGPTTLPARELDQVFFLAGLLERFPKEAADDSHGFTAWWHGRAPFDVDALMSWGEELYVHMGEFFETPGGDYRIFMRRNEVNPGGGIGMRDSFLMTFGSADAPVSEEEMRFTLSHEMFHTFQPMIAGDGGVSDNLKQSWFNEGLAVYYQGRIPYRHRMVSAQEFIDDVNVYAARYGTSLLANLPNDEVPARFWKDTRARTLPYDRGFLYFVAVEEALREAGATPLDELVQQLRVRQRNGEKLTTEFWDEIMARELGDPGVRMLKDHLAGHITMPSSSAFGPEFRHTRRIMRRFELGFDPVVLTETPRIIRGLVPGSAADAAGLRNGDEILQPIGQDRVQGDQAATLTLQIRRDCKNFEITYMPRGEEVPVTLWELA